MLEDSEGLIGGADDRWEIRAIADQAPTVTIEQPAGNIFVTPQGEVPLRIAAKDDLAHSRHRVALQPLRSHRRRGFCRPAVPRTGRRRRRSESRACWRAATWAKAKRSNIAGRWPIWISSRARRSRFGPRPATICRRSARARCGGCRSSRRSELEERLAQRQTLIFGELQRVLKLQQDARAQTKSLEIQMQQVGQLNKQDVDHAQSAELNQRQVTRTLTSPTEGIPAQIADFLADLANNRVDSPDIERHMSAIVRRARPAGRAASDDRSSAS